MPLYESTMSAGPGPASNTHATAASGVRTAAGTVKGRAAGVQPAPPAGGKFKAKANAKKKKKKERKSKKEKKKLKVKSQRQKQKRRQRGETAGV